MSLTDIFQLLRFKLYEFLSNEQKIAFLRKKGVKLGENCRIHTLSFSTEPYLIEIGNHVTIAAGTMFVTHEGSVWCFPDEIDGGIFGKIKIGNNVFIGSNCIILYNTVIGDNSIIGAGSIVKGIFPGDSVIMGNPAKVIYSMSVQKLLFRQNPGLLKTNNLTEKQCDKLIKRHFQTND